MTTTSRMYTGLTDGHALPSTFCIVANSYTSICINSSNRNRVFHTLFCRADGRSYGRRTTTSQKLCSGLAPLVDWKADGYIKGAPQNYSPIASVAETPAHTHDST